MRLRRLRLNDARLRNCSGKRSITDFKNGSIESPSAHRFMPVIVPETRSSIS